MQSIWKFPFKTDDSIQIDMPKGAEVLTVQTQNEQPCFWALVSTKAPLETRNFAIFLTGFNVPTHLKMKYIGTYQLNGGMLIFHVFELLQ